MGQDRTERQRNQHRQQGPLRSTRTLSRLRFIHQRIQTQRMAHGLLRSRRFPRRCRTQAGGPGRNDFFNGLLGVFPGGVATLRP